MIVSIFIQALISLIVILVLHYLYVFFRQNLTTPKIKDLVNKPNEEYKRIYSTIKNENTNVDMVDNNEVPNQDRMKDELKQYMKSLSSKKQDTIKLNTKSSNNVSVIPSKDETIRSFNDTDIKLNNEEISSFSIGDVSNYSSF